MLRGRFVFGGLWNTFSAEACRRRAERRGLSRISLRSLLLAFEIGLCQVQRPPRRDHRSLSSLASSSSRQPNTPPSHNSCSFHRRLSALRAFVSPDLEPHTRPLILSMAEHPHELQTSRALFRSLPTATGRSPLELLVRSREARDIARPRRASHQTDSPYSLFFFIFFNPPTWRVRARPCERK